ncbi:adenosine deaminase [Spirillospora sp. CA-142024]|uniref:adenosine deaminase n=1 Tax=Spirillospora sp. CA-142024 TaxID=3240036 RepID=UPI003D936F3F
MEVLPRVQPKAELHLHLDCCVSYACVAALRPGTTLTEYLRDYVAPAKCASLVDFLTRPSRIVQLMQTPRALRLVTDDLFTQLVADNVAYAEIRFAPLLHTAGGMRPEHVVEVVESAVAEAVAATGVQASVILCTLRHFDADASMATARLAAARLEDGLVTGFDLAGDEAGFGLDPHIAAVRHAREHGVRITAHAGEARGADGVDDVLDHLRPERIGHGVRCIEDERTLERFIAGGVHLEVCPTSNVQTMGDLMPSYADHPVDRLRRAGVALSISTDARTVANVTLDQEYERLRHVFGWTSADLARSNMAAVEASFAAPAVRRELMRTFAAAHPGPGSG